MKKIIFLSLSSLIIISCNNHNTEEPTSVQDTTTVTTMQEEEHTNEDAEAIVLDNGQKWKINEEMKPFILAMENIVDAYLKEQSKNYTFLAAQLKEKNTALIESCTMQGKSHDELHKWLHPHLERVKALEKAENEQQANDIATQIKQSFEVFYQYFQ
ncbi:MAG: hypothetical protein KF781_02080 [Chitinophagaceae bacterium]|nr:hypothetical protein [Chitinophagaceae bacterium]MCW5904297.1 hypothetical protein [Chitinophagaceae bacterium]